MISLRALAMLSLAFMLMGCAHEQHSVSTELKSWPKFLSAEEVARCKQVGWETANSPAMWERFKPTRLTTEPLKLNAAGIECYVEGDHFDNVEVAIPTGLRFGRHSSYIGVTVARGTYEALSMEESFWP